MNPKPDKMQAMVYEKYGDPEVLEMKSLPLPGYGADEVLVRIHATTVAAEDCVFRRGQPYISRLATGLFKPKRQILGTQFSGTIVAIGHDVREFRVGDEVFGETGPGFGAYAEYIALPAMGALCLKPTELSFAQAAALSGGELTALPFLRDEGQLKAGQKVLINGASGSVGTAAVQFAKYFGAHITAVCSAANFELVKSLGADEVIDYNQEDFTQQNVSYDLIFDAVGKSSFTACQPILKAEGVYMTTVLSLGIIGHQLRNLFGVKQRAKIAFTGLRSALDKAKDLALIKKLALLGKLKPIIDRTYLMSELPAAHQYVGKGHKRGNVVVLVKE